MGRKALRRRRKPRRSRRRHPQRTLRIRHGFASFGRYYFAPEKKNKYKKGLDIKRRQILFSLEGGGGGGDGRGNAEQMRPEASRSPRPRLGRGHSHPSRSLAPHPRSHGQPTAPSFPVPAYLAVLGSSLYLILRDDRGLLFSWDCDFTGILQPGAVRRSTSLCPSSRDLRLGSFRWVLGPRWP